MTRQATETQWDMIATSNWPRCLSSVIHHHHIRQPTQHHTANTCRNEEETIVTETTQTETWKHSSGAGEYWPWGSRIWRQKKVNRKRNKKQRDMRLKHDDIGTWMRSAASSRMTPLSLRDREFNPLQLYKNSDRGEEGYGRPQKKAWQRYRSLVKTRPHNQATRYDFSLLSLSTSVTECSGYENVEVVVVLYVLFAWYAGERHFFFVFLCFPLARARLTRMWTMPRFACFFRLPFHVFFWSFFLLLLQFCLVYP